MCSEQLFNGKTLDRLREEFPILRTIEARQETTWINDRKLPFAQALAECPLTMEDVLDASDRLDRFADYFRTAFPETEKTGGILESPMQPIPRMQAALEEAYGVSIPGKLWIKLDSHLPISGSIKARGGIYEVLKTAEDIAIRHGLLHPGDPTGSLTPRPSGRSFPGIPSPWAPRETWGCPSAS